MQGIRLLWFPLTSIASFWSQFQLGLAASERVFALIDAEPRIHQIDQQPVAHLIGKIEFKDVFFSYNDRQTVLAGFNLTIQAGETVAIVGHHSGKSSLARLVARFYEFQGGQLLIDGRDIRTFDLQSYHRQHSSLPTAGYAEGDRSDEGGRRQLEGADLPSLEEALFFGDARPAV